MCVCGAVCELSREILIWQVTSTSESPKDDIPLSSCDTLNKPWQLPPERLPYTFGEDTLKGSERMSDHVLKHLGAKMNTHASEKRHETLPSPACENINLACGSLFTLLSHYVIFG